MTLTIQWVSASARIFPQPGTELIAPDSKWPFFAVQQNIEAKVNFHMLESLPLGAHRVLFHEYRQQQFAIVSFVVSKSEKSCA